MDSPWPVGQEIGSQASEIDLEAHSIAPSEVQSRPSSMCIPADTEIRLARPDNMLETRSSVSGAAYQPDTAFPVETPENENKTRTSEDFETHTTLPKVDADMISNDVSAALLLQRFGTILDDVQKIVSSLKSTVEESNSTDEDSEAQRVQTTAQAGNKKSSFFGIPRNTSQGAKTPNAPAYQNVDDYERKYPEDAYGEEMGPNARVWRTYLDEALKADAELVEGWRDTTDVLLVFAGLFSAVLATFIGLTSANLQPDYTQITASLIVELNALLRAMANHVSVDSIPPSALSPDSDFPIANHDRWINGLWFTSLSVSLVAAFMSVLVKQWIQHYVSVVSGTPHDQVRIRQFRFLGVERWHMPLIIGTLPMLLHLALLLYFAGLVLFLWPLDASIAYVTLAIAILAYGFYAISNILPLWYPICPYKTPLSSLLATLMSSLHALHAILLSRFRSHYQIITRWLRTVFYGKPVDGTSEEEDEDIKGHPLARRALSHMKELENETAADKGDEVDAEALVWLYSTSSNPTVVSVTVQAISGLRLGFLKPDRDILKKVVTFKEGSVEDVMLETMDYSSCQGRLADDRRKLERFLRACHQLDAELRLSWRATKDMMYNTSDPALQILQKCHEMLVDPHYWIQYKGVPRAYLESYDYKNEGPTPFMWIVLLKNCQDTHFENPLKCWLHGMRVMHDCLSSSDSSDTLRRGMLLEYICSLSGSSHHDTGDWGEFSVLAGLSPFRIEKVLPQIYYALSQALRVLGASCSSDEPESGSEDIWPQLALPVVVLDKSLRFLVETLGWNVDPLDQEKITPAAVTLRKEMQKLVALESFWKSEETLVKRDGLCNLLVFSYYWPAWMPSWKLSWTPGLMDHFLHSYDWRLRWAHWEFSGENPDVYRLFEEREGLSKMKPFWHHSWFRNSYVEGLILWKADPGEREHHIRYLFSPKSLHRIAEEFIIKKQEDGTYKAVDEYYQPAETASALFRLCSPDQYPDIYGEYLAPFVKLVKDDPYAQWPPEPEPASAEPKVAGPGGKPGWGQLLSVGEGALSRWIPGRVKRGSEDDPQRGAEAA